MFLTMNCARTVSQIAKFINYASVCCSNGAWQSPLMCAKPINGGVVVRLLSVEVDQNSKEVKLVNRPETSILERVSALNNPTVYSNLANIKDVGQYLFQMNFNLDQVVSLFSRNPELCQYPRQNWETSVGFMVGNEVKINSIVHMLVSVPQILDRSTDQLEETFACLRSWSLTNRTICRLIREAPVLLAVEPKKVEAQFRRLMTVFTRKDIVKLIPRCWPILTNEWSELEEKLSYIIHVMGVEQPEIVVSMALVHPLQHIRLRHEFLLRTGFYKKVRPKKKPDNPRLRVVTDTPTTELVKNFVGISMQEFFVFDKMLEKEILKQEPEDGAYSDEDSDTDLEESYRRD